MKTINLLIIFFSVTVQAILGQTEFRQEDLIKATVYSKNTGGAAVLVMQNNNIIYENYHNGSDSNTATHIHSATKGFWSAVAALALQKGLITSYDELVSNTITEWQNSTIHPNKKLIKIRHLLPLSSGLSQDVEKIQGEDATAKDIYQYVVDSLKLITAPGTVFQYGPSHYYAFGVLLQRKLHSKGILLNPLQYLENEILNKIGLQYDKWTYDSSGNPHIPNGCYLTPRNWIRFGQFMLQKGKWNGIQIIDSTLIKDMFKGDGPNPGHGKFIWLNAKDGYS
ncbi:MAG: serine hydrolase, partial [Bacteroidetes bacterium]|nr:serine hydrolase [Bacteroidota bacterium]